MFQGQIQLINPPPKSGSRKRKAALSDESDFEDFNKENKGNNHISCMLDSTVVFTEPQKKRKTKPSCSHVSKQKQSQGWFLHKMSKIHFFKW